MMVVQPARFGAATRTVQIKGRAGGGATYRATAKGGPAGAFDWTGPIPIGTVITAKVGQGGRYHVRAGGGARTEVSWTVASVLQKLIAGAGGGSGQGVAGGPGGGTTGGDGGGPGGGKGGTQTTAGAAGTGNIANGNPGSGNQGGDGAGTQTITSRAWPDGGAGNTDAASYTTGGGAGGHKGGGGGAGDTGSGAGAGGSGLDGTTTGTATLYPGSGTTPGLGSDTDLGTAGQPGATDDSHGVDGKVVIYVDGALVATLSYTGADQTFTIT